MPLFKCTETYDFKIKIFVLLQRDRICVLPILRITYIQEEKPKFLWIIGTNRKVYDPFLNH